MWKHDLVPLVTSPVSALKNDAEAHLVSLSGRAQMVHRCGLSNWLVIIIHATLHNPPPPPPQLRSLCQSSHNKVASSGLFCSKASKLVASLRARSSFRVASEARCKRTCEQTITAIRVPRSYVTVCVPFSRGSTVPPSEEIPQASTVLLILLQDSYSVSIVHGFSAIECLALHRVPRHLLFTWIQMLTTETTPSCIQCCL